MQISYLIKQKSYEKIIYKLHRHPITFIPVIALFLLLILVPIVVYLLINSLFPTLLEGPVLFPITVLVGSVYCLSIYLLFFAMFIDYYLDIWVVTSDRIIDIEQFGLFSRSISELDLFRIQDVTTEVHGVFPTLFHYGNVNVKTASPNVNIIFRNIPNPNKVREDLIRLADEDRKWHYSQEKTK